MKSSPSIVQTTRPASMPQTSRGIPAAFARRVALSRVEVAETLGCSEDFVDSLIADGTLESRRVRSLVFVPACDVWALMGLAPKAPSAVSSRAASILRQVGA